MTYIWVDVKGEITYDREANEDLSKGTLKQAQQVLADFSLMINEPEREAHNLWRIQDSSQKSKAMLVIVSKLDFISKVGEKLESNIQKRTNAKEVDQLLAMLQVTTKKIPTVRALVQAAFK